MINLRGRAANDHYLEVRAKRKALIGQSTYLLGGDTLELEIC